jgi:hypothetical protein
MAKGSKSANVATRIKKVNKKRPGVHSTSRFSNSKKSKHYKKLSRGQG